MGRELREHPRTPMRCRLKVTHPEVGEQELHTQDISDGGVFVLLADVSGFAIGDKVKGQVQGMMADAPILDLEVVRLDSMGMGLRYLLDH